MCLHVVFLFWWQSGTRATRQYNSKLLAAKEARKLVEQDAKLLANRIALLKQEEEKAYKKITQTKRRVAEILRLRAENEARMAARRAAEEETRAAAASNTSVRSDAGHKEASRKALDDQYRARQQAVKEMKNEKVMMKKVRGDGGACTCCCLCVLNGPAVCVYFLCCSMRVYHAPVFSLWEGLCFGIVLCLPPTHTGHPLTRCCHTMCAQEMERRREEERLRARKMREDVHAKKEEARRRKAKADAEAAEARRREYEARVAAEEEARRRTEARVQALEKLESQMISKLRNTQILQQKAYTELERALGTGVEGEAGDGGVGDGEDGGAHSDAGDDSGAAAPPTDSADPA